MPEAIPGLLRYRIVKTNQAGNAVVTEDLPHLHQSSWTITAFQPGNPATSTVGSFTIPLFPPGSDGYMAAKAIYDQLDLGMRVEGYISPDGASEGKLKVAGMIRSIDKIHGETESKFEISGYSDLAWALYSVPFPGEVLSNDVTSAILKSYLGTNEIGWADNFINYNAANYLSTNTPGHTSGTWSATTDDGFSVISNTTGSGAGLLAQTGAAANDRWHTQFVEFTGRLNPSSDATNAGVVGIGISSSNANLNNCAVGWIVARKANGRYVLDATLAVYVAGALNGTVTKGAVLNNVDDPQGFIPLTMSCLFTLGGQASSTASASITVNGRTVLGLYPDAYDPGTGTQYPFLFFGTPASGSATAYLTNLVQETRFTTDGSSTAALFGNGTISAATHSLAYGVDPGPTFLEVWSKLATREGWYWRYTPQAYVVGTRTLGTVDFASDPGTDLSTSVLFKRRLGNLISLELSANADNFSSGTSALGEAGLDGAGIAIWRDVSTMNKYGVLEDYSSVYQSADFNSLRRAAFSITANKTTIGSLGSKTAVVLRDADTVDRWRELDHVLIDDPDLGINNLSARVVSYTFTENDPRQTVVLDQFSETYDSS